MVGFFKSQKNKQKGRLRKKKKKNFPLPQESNSGLFASLSASYATRQHCPRLLKLKLIFVFIRR